MDIRTKTIANSVAACDELRELIGIRRAAELAGVTTQTVLRWMTAGLHGVRLRATRMGVRWRTTAAWLAEFGEALAARGPEKRAKRP